jgi:hypothetical protein
MRIKVHCDANRGVTEALAGNLRMDTGGQHMGRASVSQIVKVYARQRLVLGEQQKPLVGDGSWLQGTTIGLRNDKSAI